ncbi:hypothetical protein HOLleu_27094 [Holothuria leucospilota]|uniref:Ig-like domain-containing protein n=1 Tax=Holothuria leucospilota TaxID=206669 RepID=A0A9Q1H2H4_HOLLE|nr:hypothetical protein HOLleu_27094 [Holothuria leucospilota]
MCILSFPATEVCPKNQTTELRRQGSIICHFPDEYTEVHWFDNISETSSPVITYKPNEGNKYGQGLDSGTYDVLGDGSLIITNVSTWFERCYKAIVYLEESLTPVIYVISLRVIVLPSPPYIQITGCDDVSRQCVIRENSTKELTCAVYGARPSVTLQWIAEDGEDISFIDHKPVFKERGETADTILSVEMEVSQNVLCGEEILIKSSCRENEVKEEHGLDGVDIVLMVVYGLLLIVIAVGLIICCICGNWTRSTTVERNGGPTRDSQGASPKRCRSCKQFLAEWDAHDLCVRCRSCSTKSRCSICRQWSVEWAWLAPKKKAGRKRPDNSSEPTGELSGKKVSEAHSGANPSSPAPSSGKKSSGSSSKRSRRSRATTSKTTNPPASSPATTSLPSTTSVTTNPPAPLSSSAESTNPPGSQRTAAIVGTNTPGALPSSASNLPESQQTASIIGVNTPGALPAPTTNPPESQQTAAIVGVNTPGAFPTTSIEDSSISPETHSNVPFVIVNPPGALSGTALMGHNLPGALVNTPGALVNTPGSLLTSLLLTSNTPASLPGIASSEVNTPEALPIGTLTAPNPPGSVPATAVDSSRGSSVTSRPGVSLSLVSSLPATVSHTQPCDVSMLSGPSSQNDPSATLREIFLSSDSPSLGNRDFEDTDEECGLKDFKEVSV